MTVRQTRWMPEPRSRRVVSRETLPLARAAQHRSPPYPAFPPSLAAEATCSCVPYHSARSIYVPSQPRRGLSSPPTRRSPAKRMRGNRGRVGEPVLRAPDPVPPRDSALIEGRRRGWTDGYADLARAHMSTPSSIPTALCAKCGGRPVSPFHVKQRRRTRVDEERPARESVRGHGVVTERLIGCRTAESAGRTPW